MASNSAATRGRPPGSIDPHEVVRLHREGRTVTSLARQFSCKGARIKAILGSENEPIRFGAFGVHHPRWKGGRRICGEYVRVTLDRDDPLRGEADSKGEIFEHRLVMMRALGRPLRSIETVHHIDGNRANNVLGNLQLRFGQHGQGIVLVCRACGSHNVEPEALSGD